MELHRVERLAGPQPSKLKVEEINDSAVAEAPVGSSQNAEVDSITSSSDAHASQSSRELFSSATNTQPASIVNEQLQAEKPDGPDFSDSASNNDESGESLLSTGPPVDDLSTGANHFRREYPEELSGTLVNLTHGKARKIFIGAATSVCGSDVQLATPLNALSDAPHANTLAQIQDYIWNVRAYPPPPDSGALDDSQKQDDKGKGRAIESLEESIDSMADEDSESESRSEQIDEAALPDLRARLHKRGESYAEGYSVGNLLLLDPPLTPSPTPPKLPDSPLDIRRPSTYSFSFTSSINEQYVYETIRLEFATKLGSNEESRSPIENHEPSSSTVDYFSSQPHGNLTHPPTIKIIQPTSEAVDGPKIAITPSSVPPPWEQATSIPELPSKWRKWLNRLPERFWYRPKTPHPRTRSSPVSLALPGIKLWVKEDTKKRAEDAKQRQSYSEFFRAAPSQPRESTVGLETMPGAARANVFLYLLDRPKDLNITLTEEVITTNDNAENPDDYEIIRALAETVGSRRYWVLDVDNIECPECVKIIREQRELMKRFFKGIGKDDAKRIQYIRLEGECINPDSLASAVNILKRNLSDLRGAQIILHSSETRHSEISEINDEITAKRFVCALQELERILPKEARLDVIGSHYHPVLKKMWEDHRRPWWMNNRTKRTACFNY
ncbi:hypothetical protein B7494_g7166 [Chlorociboria aeruginascens]|nr:hypothetical protein B7494_g7166 [Chlorociboria aeruginascens]